MWFAEQHRSCLVLALVEWELSSVTNPAVQSWKKPCSALIVLCDVKKMFLSW